MTVSTWERDRCPACQKQESVELDEVVRLCLNCRHEWEPAHTVGPLREQPITTETVPAPLLAAVPDPEPEDEWSRQLREARSRYLGAEVIAHDLEAQGTVIQIDDDGWVRVEFGSGFYVDLLPNEFTVVDADVIPDETIAAIATTGATVAAQMIRAAAQTITQRGDERVMTLAPNDWLPDEPGMMPVIEHGACYAIAYLAIQYGIPTDQLVSIATMLDAAAEAAKGANQP